MFVDSHAHLDAAKFDSDRDQVIERARAADIEAILAIGSGSGPGTLDCAIKLAQQYPNLYASIGIHPHEAQLASEKDFIELERLSQEPAVIAWGEIGLDYYYHHSPRQTQQRVFIRQMELARAARLPIIVHCRASQVMDDAWNDALELIRQQGATSGGIFHCFTSTLEHARAALDLGFLISFSGVITFPRAQELCKVARQIPVDRILIETDCPFLSPVPHRGQRNEPAFVVETAKKLAEIRGLSLEEVAHLTTQNFYTFFALEERGSR